MSKDILTIGSETKPPVLVLGEYPQWRLRMIQFLENIDENLMISITEEPVEVYIEIPGVLATETTPEIPPTRMKKDVRYYSEAQKKRHTLDRRALTLLTLAIPNDLYNRIDSKKSAKGMWDELEK